MGGPRGTRFVQQASNASRNLALERTIANDRLAKCVRPTVEVKHMSESGASAVSIHSRYLTIDRRNAVSDFAETANRRGVPSSTSRG